MALKFVIALACLLANARAVPVDDNVKTPPAWAPRGIQNRIISGIPAAAGQYPWFAVIKEYEGDDLHCGGSIIAATWVLTAAHCTYGLNSVFLMFGTIILDNPNAVTMTSSKLYQHPNYNANNLNNDVSLIELPTALTFSASIQPLPLVSSSAASTSWQGTVATILGFGLTDDEYLDFSSVLLYAQVQIIDNSQCTPVFGESVVISSTICGQGDGGSNMSICSGDSGGPLVVRDATSGAWKQIGINSFVAQDMCTEGYPSGYVRLTSFLDYISQTTGMPLS